MVSKLILQLKDKDTPEEYRTYVIKNKPKAEIEVDIRDKKGNVTIYIDNAYVEELSKKYDTYSEALRYAKIIGRKLTNIKFRKKFSNEITRGWSNN